MDNRNPPPDTRGIVPQNMVFVYELYCLIKWSYKTVKRSRMTPGALGPNEY